MPKFTFHGVSNPNSSIVFYSNSQKAKSFLAAKTVVDPESFTTNGSAHVIVEVDLPESPEVNVETSELVSQPSAWINAFNELPNGILPGAQELNTAGINKVVDVSWYN
jgi:hypothetical protein